jgi:hypothetical protein
VIIDLVSPSKHCRRKKYNSRFANVDCSVAHLIKDEVVRSVEALSSYLEGLCMPSKCAFFHDHSKARLATTNCAKCSGHHFWTIKLTRLLLMGNGEVVGPAKILELAKGNGNGSHLCGVVRCNRPSHICYETSRNNRSRVKSPCPSGRCESVSSGSQLRPERL